MIKIQLIDLKRQLQGWGVLMWVTMAKYSSQGGEKNHRMKLKNGYGTMTLIITNLSIIYTEQVEARQPLKTRTAVRSQGTVMIM